MDHPKRRAISYIAAALLTGNQSGSVFDYVPSRYFNFSGSVGSSINLFDFSRSSYLSGTPNSIFDYSSRQYISLNVGGNEFSGFDYGSNSFFSGKVNGNAISFFDYKEGKYFDFAV